MNNIKLLTLLIVISIQQLSLANNTGHGITVKSDTSKTYYLGIASSHSNINDKRYHTQFPSADSDVVLMSTKMSELPGFRGKTTLIQGPHGVQSIIDTILSFIKEMKSGDKFFFHFSGFSNLAATDSTANKSEIRFYLNNYPGKISEYFTLNMLKLWLDIIPAREQIVLVDAGETRFLQSELISNLMDTDPNKIITEKRKRTIITNDPWGYEYRGYGALTLAVSNYFTARDPIGFSEIKSGTKLWRNSFQSTLNGGIGGGEFEYKSQKFFDSIKLNRQKVLVIREWEIAETISGVNIKVKVDSSGAKRGVNMALRPKKMAGNAAQPPKCYALVIGMDKYQHMDPLSNPVYDAKELADVLAQKYRYKVRFDVNCTSETFYSHINYYQDSVVFNPHDQFLIYIAGHGNYNERMRTGGIAFVDAKPLDKNPGMNNYIQHLGLLNSLLTTGCNNVMVILDVCQGGSLSVGVNTDQNAAACRNTPMDSIYWRAMPNNKENSEVVRNLDCQNRVFLTSGGFEYVPDGRPGAHSPFSNALLQVLSSNQESILSTADLTQDVRKYLKDKYQDVPTPASGRFGVNSTVTDYIFYKDRK